MLKTLDKSQAKSALVRIERKFAKLPQGTVQNELQELSQKLPDDPEILLHFAKLLISSGWMTRAIEVLHPLTQTQPTNALALALLGKALLSTGELDRAVGCLQQALELHPGLFEAQVFMADTQYFLGRYDRAEQYLRLALAQQPENPALLSDLAIYLIVQERPEEAIQAAEKAVAQPEHPTETLITLGSAYAEVGKLEEAKAQFRKALKRDKHGAAAYSEIARITRFSDVRDPLIVQMESVLKDSLPVQTRFRIHFALGKAYDDCKVWDQAFQHYRLGNMIAGPELQQRREHIGAVLPPPAESTLKVAKRVFSRKSITHLAEAGSESNQPVFVVGMPRSGTTLLEQIIASHQQAAGSGELIHIQNLAASIANGPNPVQHWRQHLTAENLKAWADQYLALLNTGHDGELRIVDKAPDNYLHLGLIHLMFPRAAILHIARDPLDTALSCYFQMFRELDWSFSLEDIAQRYLTYRKTISFWRKTLPEGRVYDVSYEDLVTDPENTVRQLLSHLGLEWDSACLQHHQKTRSISTSSLWQARQPIYARSVKRWHHYASNIQPLIDKLEPHLDEKDRNWLREHGATPTPAWKRVFG